MKFSLKNRSADSSAEAPLVQEAAEGEGYERAFRDALGKFATGVAVVTTPGPDGPVGMTINSFASVSLNPALILWSVDRNSYRYSTFSEAKHFAINVLDEDQALLALDFARVSDAFGGWDWHSGENDAPVLDDALAHFECELEAVHPGGDHDIIVGRVKCFASRHGNPLVFSSGKFGTVGGMRPKDD